MHRTETKTRNGAVLRRGFTRLSVLWLVMMSAGAQATTDSANAGFVDSVYSWGTWELGLDPASGPDAPSGNALNDRSRSLKFRPNENAAYMVRSVPVAPAITLAPTVPTSPSGPSTPLTPVTPPPMPIGPPGFSSGPATTADPRR